MEIKKAVITAAARGARLYPTSDTVQKGMLPIVDRDGVSRPVLQIIANEALEAGVDEICVVCAPGDERRYLAQFGRIRKNLVESFSGEDWARPQAKRVERLLDMLHFVVQEKPLGYGHAVYCAREFAGSDPFLLLLSDHLYVSTLSNRGCAGQLTAAAVAENCAVSAVNATRENLLGRYGTLTGKPVPGRAGLYEIEKILEKPSLSKAEQELQTPGLRVGHYLCFFGMHVLTPTIFDILGKEWKGGGNDLQLTPSLQRLARDEKYLAFQIRGDRYDIGGTFGLLRAQMALGLAGTEHEDLLEAVLETLAEETARSSAGRKS